jgi:hypothetical protein
VNAHLFNAAGSSDDDKVAAKLDTFDHAPLVIGRDLQADRAHRYSRAEVDHRREGRQVIVEGRAFNDPSERETLRG